MTIPKLSPTNITSTPAELITFAKVDSYAVKHVNFSPLTFRLLRVSMVIYDWALCADMLNEWIDYFYSAY